MRTIRSGAAILALAVAGSTACSINLNAEQYVNKEHKTFAVTGKADVELKTFDGSIEVTSWDKPEVAVTIERRADTQAEAEALKVTAEQTGNRIVIQAVKPERSESQVQVGFHHGRSVRFVVSVPRTTDLNATSGDGSISVSGITGRVEARSGDGSIATTDIKGDVGLDTGDGSISADNVSGNLKINTGDGFGLRQGAAARPRRAHRRRLGERRRDVSERGASRRLGADDRRWRHSRDAAGQLQRAGGRAHRRRRHRRQRLRPARHRRGPQRSPRVHRQRRPDDPSPHRRRRDHAV